VICIHLKLDYSQGKLLLLDSSNLTNVIAPPSLDFKMNNKKKNYILSRISKKCGARGIASSTKMSLADDELARRGRTTKRCFAL
jgi:hypothetical protein